MKKKLFSGLLVVALLLSVFSFGFDTNKSQAANKYWICGSSYVGAAGGKMKLYMKKNSIVIKGKALKCNSKKQFYNMKGKKIKYSKKTFKLAKNCKVVECEGMGEYKYSYSKYRKSRGIKPSKNSVGINAGIVVKNGKVSAIYFSA